MFDSKKLAIPSLDKKVASVKSTNSFISAGMKKSAETRSGNNALKYSTTGNAFVDQFGSVGLYKKPRSFNEIASDCEILWSINPLLSVVFMLYLRMITRVVVLFNGLSTKISQKGAELKHEAISRMLWLHVKQPSTFWKNIGLFVSIGSWKDVFVMLQYDLIYHTWEGKILDWDKMGSLILTGLENKNTVNLVKKYLPQIKARSKCTTPESYADTLVAKWLCTRIFKRDGDHGTIYRQYRKIKTSGTAHTWQQLISQRQFDRIDFNAIHGRALSLLVRSKFLKNHGLEDKYNSWIEKPETDVKYTGFVHELFQVCQKYHSLVSMPKAEQNTINKQFDTLVTKSGEKGITKLIVVRDTSGSMGSTAVGCNMASGDIAKALALYFSNFLTGVFADSWIEFNSDARMHSWQGDTPLEKWYNDHASYVGNTSFLSVIRLFCRIKGQGISESDFPSGILCISDGEFDQTALDDTNVNAARKYLEQAGFSKEYIDNFVIVLWNIPNSYYSNRPTVKFETYGKALNVFYFGGYSASVVSFLSEKIRTPEELFESAMNQEILSLVEL